MDIQLTHFAYIAAPFITWFITGCTKFLVNSFRQSDGSALQQIGLGGFPSNHSAIVSCMAALIILREGWQHPAAGVAITLAFIVIMDANGLRKKIGDHARRINHINHETSLEPLRERIGHSKIEIAGGIAMGITCAYLINLAF